MAKLDFYFDNQKVNEDIANWRDLEIEVNFDDETGQGTVKSGKLEFVGALADKINNWNAHGLTGGYGIFEAPPFRIEVCGSNDVIFKGGVNVAACESLYECDKIIAPLRHEGVDMLNDRASAFTFAYLASLTGNAPGRIKQSDYILIPYVINTIPNFVNVMTSALGLFVLIKEFKSVIQKITAQIKKLIGDVIAALASFIPPVTFVGIGLAIGTVLVDIVILALLITYLLFIVKSIIEMTLMIFNNLIQKVKYKKAMRVKDLFQKACDHLGFQFSSSLLTQTIHKDEIIIPRKTALFTNTPINFSSYLGFQQSQKDFDDNTNPASVGYFDGTFADLILFYEDRLNAEVRIIGNTFHFELKDSTILPTNYTLPNIQRKNADPHKTNACELTANYLIIHQLDDQETNTYDLYEGTSAYMTLSPIAISNQKNILLKGVTEKRLNVSLAKRKTQLNGVEKIFSDIYTSIYSNIAASNGLMGQVIQNIIQSLSAISALVGGQTPVFNILLNPSNPFAARVGMVMLSNDFIGVPKVAIIDSANKLVSNNDLLTSAKYLMDNYHYSNFAIRTTDSNGNITNDHNQWLIYEDKEIDFCCEDYKKVLNNNAGKTYDQKSMKIKNLVWNPHKNTARITYRVKEKYTKNLKNSYVIDGK